MPKINGEQERILEKVSNIAKYSKQLSHVQLFVTPMDYAICGILQARILEQLAFPSPGDLTNPGIKPRCPSLQVDSLLSEPPGKPKSIATHPYSSIYLSLCLYPDEYIYVHIYIHIFTHKHTYIYQKKYPYLSLNQQVPF